MLFLLSFECCGKLFFGGRFVLHEISLRLKSGEHFVLRIIHLYHNDIDDDLTLIFDLRYCFSIPVSIYKKSFDNKKMLNRELLSDIQVTYGNYVSQLGYTKII